MKFCKYCRETKLESSFAKNPKTKDGLHNKCKDCTKDYNQQWYAKNRDRVLHNVINWQSKNPNNVRKYKKKWDENNAEYKRDWCRQYARKNSEARKEYRNQYRKNNLEYERNRELQRRCEDPLYKLAQNYRGRVVGAFKHGGFSKNTKTAKMLGCTFEELTEHLENQFSDGMTWENYGKWHVEHIVPLSSADTEEELIELCHYTNLQPLWAEDNLKKNNRIEV